jgi:hypothetical protein
VKGLSRFAWPVRAVGALVLVGAAVGLGTSAAQARNSSRPHHPATTPVVMNGYKCTVVATAKHRHAVGHAGDVVCGVSGNDVLKAVGSGRVVLIGGPGHDKLIASHALKSMDTLIGGSGPDTMVTGTGGDDTIDTGSGNDTINCPSNGGGGGGGGTGNTGSDSRIHLAASKMTVVGADAGDTENSDCSGDSQDSAQLEFQGVVNTTDGSTTMNITIEDNSDAAQAWLDANSDPTSVDISLTGANIEVDNGGTLMAGDAVEVAANPSSTTLAGSTLTAVDVQAESPSTSGFDN